MLKASMRVLVFALTLGMGWVRAEVDRWEVNTSHPSPYGIYNTLETDRGTFLATESGGVIIGGSTPDPAYKLKIVGNAGFSNCTNLTACPASQTDVSISANSAITNNGIAPKICMTGAASGSRCVCKIAGSGCDYIGWTTTSTPTTTTTTPTTTTTTPTTSTTTTTCGGEICDGTCCATGENCCGGHCCNHTCCDWGDGSFSCCGTCCGSCTSGNCDDSRCCIND